MSLLEEHVSNQEKQISFLWHAANILPTGTSVSNLLKSHYLNKTRNLAERSSIKLPNTNYGKSILCEKCSLPWSEQNFQIKLKIRRKKSKDKKNDRKPHIKKNTFISKCSFCGKQQKTLLEDGTIQKKKRKVQKMKLKLEQKESVDDSCKLLPNVTLIENTTKNDTVPMEEKKMVTDVQMTKNSDQKKKVKLTLIETKKVKTKKHKMPIKQMSLKKTDSKNSLKKPNNIQQLAKLLASSTSTNSSSRQSDKFKKLFK